MTHDPESCKSIFVSWTWLVAALAGLIVTVGSIAWAGSARITTIEINQTEMSTQLDKLQVISTDLDSIKHWVRRQ